jgi:hypothetical protein
MNEKSNPPGRTDSERRDGVDWRELLIVLGFVASIALVGIFVARTVHMVRQMRQDEPIRPWMSIPYIAHSYRLPPAVLYQALGLPEPPRDRRPLTFIAREQRRPVQAVIADLQRAIVRARSPSAPPTTSPGSAP